MLHLLQEEIALEIFRRTPRIGKAYFNQCQKLVSINLDILRERTVEASQNDRNKLNEVMTAFAAQLEALRNMGARSQSEKADIIINQLRDLTFTYAALNSSASYSFARIKKDLCEARGKDIASRDQMKEISTKLRAKEAGTKVKEKAFPRRQTEVVLYRELLERPDIHIIGKIPSSLTLDHVLFLLFERKLICIKDNPYFYLESPGMTRKLPMNALGITECIADIRKEIRGCVQLHVLCDRPSLIIFEFRERRIFGNIWDAGKAENEWILKDVRGDIISSQLLKVDGDSDIPVEYETAPYEYRAQKRSTNLTAALHEAKSAEVDVFIRSLVPAPAASSFHSTASSTSDSYVSADDNVMPVPTSTETHAGTAVTNPSDQPPQFPSQSQREFVIPDYTLREIQTSINQVNRDVPGHLTADSSTFSTIAHSAPRPSEPDVVEDSQQALGSLPYGHQQSVSSISPQPMSKSSNAGEATNDFLPTTSHEQTEYGTAYITHNTHGRSLLSGVSRPSGLQPTNVSGIAITTNTTVNADLPTVLQAPVSIPVVKEKVKKQGFFSRIVKAAGVVIRNVIGST